jgi:ABC-type nickel/cobalt efflux system permease component RcnA
MTLKHRIKRWQIKKAVRNNAGRIAAVTAAFVGVAVGVRRWRSMRSH